jgi:hypothetical protein
MSSDHDPDHELAPEWMTPAWLSRVLGHEVSAVGVRRIGDGLVGMNLRLVVTYADAAAIEAGAPRTVVTKLPSPDPTSRATGVALRNYEREVKFYRDLSGTIDMRVARCWHADWDESSGDFVLVLEDLAPAEQGNQLTGCSIEQARVAVLELAKLHGPRWGDPTLADLEWLGRRSSREDSERLAGLYQMFLPGFMATYAKYLDDDQQRLVTEFADRLVEWAEGTGSGPLTVTHGDYRLDNLMFASPAGGYPVAAVDWQTPGHGPGVNDVSYFMGAGLLPDDRRAVERELVRGYGEALRDYDVTIDDDELWRQYVRGAYSGVIMTVIASQVVATTERSESLFEAMGTRHTRHALDLGAPDLI